MGSFSETYIAPFFLRFGLPSTFIRSTLPPKMYLFKKALQSGDFWKRRFALLVLFGWVKKEVFENDYASRCWMQSIPRTRLGSDTSKCACSHQRRHRFQYYCVFVWQVKTIKKQREDVDMFENRDKISGRFQTKTDGWLHRWVYWTCVILSWSTIWHFIWQVKTRSTERN